MTDKTDTLAEMNAKAMITGPVSYVTDKPTEPTEEILEGIEARAGELLAGL